MLLKKTLLLLTLSPIFIFGQTDIVSSQTSARHQLLAKRPNPPRRIPPNKVKPGGGLDYGQQSCSSEQKSLIALIPVENPVLTTQAHPSFLFYIPDRVAAMSHGEFSLFTTEDKTRIYSTEIALDSTPGIIKIDLPPTSENALKANQPYHWYFKIYCKNQTSKNGSDSPTFLDVNGWIERVTSTDTRSSHIETASPEIWYDAIALAAENLMATPQDPTARERWLKLLQHINREHLLDVNIKSVTTDN